MTNKLQKTIGTLSADSPRNKSSRIVISNGFWAASGKFVEIVKAVEQLELALIAYGFSESEKNYNGVKAARLRLFDSLKQIEIAIAATTNSKE